MNQVEAILIELKGKSLVVVEQHVMLYEAAVDGKPVNIDSRTSASFKAKFS